MIITNYSSQLARPSNNEVGTLNKEGAISQDTPKATLSGGQKELPSENPSQQQGLLSGKSTELRQTSVEGSEASSNQATERQQEQIKLLKVRELAERDREVRTHEQIHASAGGKHASAPSYT